METLTFKNIRHSRFLTGKGSIKFIAGEGDCENIRPITMTIKPYSEYMYIDIHSTYYIDNIKYLLNETCSLKSDQIDDELSVHPFCNTSSYNKYWRLLQNRKFANMTKNPLSSSQNRYREYIKHTPSMRVTNGEVFQVHCINHHYGKFNRSLNEHKFDIPQIKLIEIKNEINNGADLLHSLDREKVLRRILGYVERIYTLQPTDLKVELTDSLSVNIYVSLNNQSALLIKKPLNELQEMGGNDFIFSLFIDGECQITDVISLDEIIEGSKRLLNVAV